MPAAPPKERYVSFPSKGVLNEWANPLDLGGNGLTDCNNLIYHRDGAWGKRAGAARFALPSGPGKTPVNGYRWYRATPSQITKLVVYEQNHLYIGNDETSLHDLGQFSLSGKTAPDFCSMRDPQAGGLLNPNGADVLIITGIVLPNGSPATGSVTVSGLPGTQPSGGYITVTVSNGNSVTTPKYYVTGADNPDSIASNIVQLINASAAFLNQSSFAPFINKAYYTSTSLPFGAPDTNGQPQNGSANPTATIFLGALTGGSGGNSITYSVSTSGSFGTGSTLTVTAACSNFTGGGQSWSGPARLHFEDGTVQALSYMAPNAFAYCTTFHNHLVLWGDPNNPDDVFLSDINQPEAFTFMIEGGSGLAYQNGLMTGPNNGGYHIGRGDGDATVNICLPAGNAMYIFKGSHIYMMEGYDFQAGEYTFSVTPQVVGYGAPNRYCAAVLEGQIVFWSGFKCLRLAIGAYEPEHIGMPIPLSEGKASAGNQLVVRVTAGDMLVETQLNEKFVTANVSATPVKLILRSIALFAVDFGDGHADTILMYDDEKTQLSGTYAWSKWTGWDIGAWVRYGGGLDPSGLDADKPKLNFITPGGSHFAWAGGSAAFDFGSNPIPWMAQPGWITGGTPEILKNFHGVYLNASCTVGANFTTTLIPGQIIQEAPPPQASQYGTEPMELAFQSSAAPANGEACNSLRQYVNTGQQVGQLPVQANAVIVQIAEDGTSGAGFEISSYGLDVVPEESFAQAHG